ncbi:MAG: cell division protein FtsZ, partial [Betaproteobacteria bacterium]
MAFEILETETRGTVIKVIGVGGAGGNAVEHMIRRGVQGVEFICANTDHQALARSSCKHLIQLGKTGLGAGSRPEAGKQAAEEGRERIADALRGAHMVFITAGMGGGTGTGAAPVVAEVAKELGILTVAVVSKPFEFEGPKRMKHADGGINELEANVHSLIVILNNKLEEVLGEDAQMGECFKAADDVLHNACAGIAEIINIPGLVNVDFEDVKTVMSEHGKAMMGTAVASGIDRARVAAEQAVSSPLLEGVDLSNARGVLVNITASSSLKMKETREVMNTIRAFAAEDATVIFGTVCDEAMGEALRVTVVATGLGRSAARKQAAAPLQV